LFFESAATEWAFSPVAMLSTKVSVSALMTPRTGPEGKSREAV
jgi:hypothetical protein